jgi:hypothetical protein
MASSSAEIVVLDAHARRHAREDRPSIKADDLNVWEDESLPMWLIRRLDFRL